MGRHYLKTIAVRSEPQFPAVTVLTLTPVTEPRAPVERRYRTWRAVIECARRHLPPELIGTALGLAAALAVHHQSGSLAVAAVAGTAGGCVGYFGTVAVADAWREWRRRGGHPAQRAISGVRSAVSGFGPAEVCDVAVVRPGLFYLVPTLLSGPLVLGLLAAKLIADVMYVVVVRKLVRSDSAATVTSRMRPRESADTARR